MANVVMVVHEENGRFGASFPDFPGCTTVAGDLDTLVAKAADALAFHVAGLVEDGEPVPQVRSQSELWNDPQFQADRKEAAFVTLLPVELPGKTVRVNITLNESALDMIDRAAAKAGESRSGFLVSSALKRVQEMQPQG